jgi:SAM-dependent methyltransferase
LPFDWSSFIGHSHDVEPKPMRSDGLSPLPQRGLPLITRKILNRLRRYRRAGFARSARIIIDTALLSGLRLLFGFAPWHSQSPSSARPYRIGLAALVNDLKPKCVVEVGCGLGAILSRIESDRRFGYDTDAGVVRAARLLHGRSIRFVQGGFEQITQTDIDVLIAVNWPHEFAPEQLERWIMPLLPSVKYLLVDAIEASSPLAYNYYHDFSFLDGTAEQLFADSFGEDHRRFLLYKVVR